MFSLFVKQPKTQNYISTTRKANTFWGNNLFSRITISGFVSKCRRRYNVISCKIYPGVHFVCVPNSVAFKPLSSLSFISILIKEMAILTCVRLIAGHKERSYVYLFFECQRSAMLASKYKDSFCVWYVIGTAKQKIMYDKHYLRKKERNKRRRTDDTFITGIAILKRNYAETQIIIRRRSLLTSLCCFVVLHSTIVLLPRIHISTHHNGFWLFFLFEVKFMI